MSLISVTGSQDGRAEIVMINPSGGGGAFHTYQTAQGVDTAWHKWDTLAPGSTNLASAVSALDGSGRLALAWLNGGVIWVAAATTAGGGLRPARALDTQNLKELTLATNKDGRLEFLALDNNGVLWSVAQSVEGSWDNLNTHFLDGNGLQQIVVTPYGDGRLTVVALGADKEVFRIEQQGPGNNWGGWVDLGGTDIQGVAAGANADGRLEVVVVGGNGTLYDYYQTAGGGWSGWRTLASGNLVAQPKLAMNADGRLEVFALGNDGGLHHTYQTGPNGGWVSSLALIGVEGPVNSASVARLSDGRLVLVVAHQAACYCTYLSQSVKNALTFQQLDQQPGVACPPPPATIKIVTFKAVPDYINLGQSSQLQYDVEANATCNPFKFTLTRQVSGSAPVGVPYGTLSLPAGSITVTPSVETKYTLLVQCVGSGASDQKTSTVTIAPVPASGALVVLANGPFYDHEPVADESFMATVVVENLGNAASIAFDVTMTIDSQSYPSMHESALSPGEVRNVTFPVSGLSSGFHDLDWAITQYPSSSPFGTQLAL